MTSSAHIMYKNQTNDNSKLGKTWQMVNREVGNINFQYRLLYHYRKLKGVMRKKR